jgi:hypothetical protein
MSGIYSSLPLPLTGWFKRMVFLPRNESLKRGGISFREPEIIDRFNKIYSSGEMKGCLFQEWIKEAIASSGDRRSTIAELQNVSPSDPLS